MSVPYVGVLLNRTMYKGIPTGKTQTEVLDFYEEGARRYGVKPCYFRLEDIHYNAARVTVYIKEKGSYCKASVPIPKIIHNRALYFTQSARSKIDNLVEQGVVLFNQWNRYSKHHIHSLLVDEPRIVPHLPHSESGTIRNLRKMMRKYPTLFLKPNSGSIGVGIMRLTKKDDLWVLTYASIENGRKKWRTLSFKEKIPNRIKQAFLKRSFLIQEELQLATYQGRPFDIRVSVQKNEEGDWHVTGMVGKVARSGHFLSNVAQGGKVYKVPYLLREYPALDPDKVREDIAKLSVRIADYLSGHLPHLADVGLDIGITKEGFPYFIECNGRDQRYAFRNGRMLKEWKETYANPMGYAKYLMENLDVPEDNQT
ncbi:YheC/YheD family protein [Aneurinibacillus terranovensis]|uniref:YheC/YheD family endospore coat-associated protein n=1 Tax=Aneurinibacillus terranovensis TaxID=278991 RepID=UPI00041F6ADB|nr:YheC/YheD family protein [Aneurinibacillus terranovensis]